MSDSSDPMDCSLPGSSIHGIFQARVLEWGPIAFSVSVPAAAAAAAKSLQSCPTLCDPIDGSPPGSPIPGILQARTLEGVAISFSRGSSQAKDRTLIFALAGRFFTTEPPGRPWMAVETEFHTPRTRSLEQDAVLWNHNQALIQLIYKPQLRPAS